MDNTAPEVKATGWVNFKIILFFIAFIIVLCVIYYFFYYDAGQGFSVGPKTEEFLENIKKVNMAQSKRQGQTLLFAIKPEASKCNLSLISRLNKFVPQLNKAHYRIIYKVIENKQQIEQATKAGKEFPMMHSNVATIGRVHGLKNIFTKLEDILMVIRENGDGNSDSFTNNWRSQAGNILREGKERGDDDENTDLVSKQDREKRAEEFMRTRPGSNEEQKNQRVDYYGSMTASIAPQMHDNIDDDDYDFDLLEHDETLAGASFVGEFDSNNVKKKLFGGSVRKNDLGSIYEKEVASGAYDGDTAACLNSMKGKSGGTDSYLSGFM